jgi:hypothetical protein
MELSLSPLPALVIGSPKHHIAEIEWRAWHRWDCISSRRNRGARLRQQVLQRWDFPGCRLHENQGLTQSASNPKLITHLADFSVQEVNFEHIF